MPQLQLFAATKDLDVRICACGDCGRPTSGPDVAFVRGHNARVALRRADQPGLLPVLPTRTTRTCAYPECGEPLVLGKSKFCAAHYRHKVPTVGHVEPCIACGKSIRVRPCEGHRSYCSLRCKRAAALDRLKPWNRIQMRCVGYMRRRGINLEQFADLVGSSSGALRSWWRREGSTLSRRSLVGIAGVLDITVDNALAEAGGVTAEVRATNHGQEMARQNFPFAGTDQAKDWACRGGQAAKGRAKSEHWREAQRDTRARRPELRPDVHERVMKRQEAFKKWAQSTGGRAVTRFYLHLRWDAPEPSREQIRAWADADAAVLGISVRAVLDEWLPFSERLGLTVPRPIGRKPLDARYELVQTLKEHAAKSRTGRMTNGFWDMAAVRVAELEGSDPMTGHQLQVYCRKYERSIAYHGSRPTTLQK